MEEEMKMNTKYKITGIGSNDSHYNKPELIGLVGKFRFESAFVPANGFSTGTFFPDKKGSPIYFCEVQLEEIKMIINIDGVKFEGSVTDVYDILEKLGLTNRLATYTSSTHGEVPIYTMDTRHIRNALLKMWREEDSPAARLARNTVKHFVTAEQWANLDEVLKEYPNASLVRALRVIQPMIPNTEFFYLLKELETRDDED